MAIAPQPVLQSPWFGHLPVRVADLGTPPARWHHVCMRLEGWNHIPNGYLAEFETQTLPLWLRAWRRIPFVDRFSYPLIVARGHGYLVAMPGFADEDRGPVDGGWQVRPSDYEPPGSRTFLS